jgi:guanine deaminase
VGLGSDVAGGTHTNIFRVMGDAIQMSKLYWRLVDGTQPPLTVPEALYLATVGGGKFFGMVGSFDEGYEFDALVIDDSSFVTPRLLTLENRLERIIYLADHHQVYAKYIQGRKVKEGYHEVNK